MGASLVGQVDVFSVAPQGGRVVIEDVDDSSESKEDANGDQVGLGDLV